MNDILRVETKHRVIDHEAVRWETPDEKTITMKWCLEIESTQLKAQNF